MTKKGHGKERTWHLLQDCLSYHDFEGCEVGSDLVNRSGSFEDVSVIVIAKERHVLQHFVLVVIRSEVLVYLDPSIKEWEFRQ